MSARIRIGGGLLSAVIALIVALWLVPGLGFANQNDGNLGKLATSPTYVATQAEAQIASHDRIAALEMRAEDEMCRGADKVVWDEETGSFVFSGYIGSMKNTTELRVETASDQDHAWLVWGTSMRGMVVAWNVEDLSNEDFTSFSYLYSAFGVETTPVKIIVGSEAPSLSTNKRELTVPTDATEYPITFKHAPYLNTVTVDTTSALLSPAADTADPEVESYDVSVVGKPSNVSMRVGAEYGIEQEELQWDIEGVESLSDWNFTIPLTWNVEGKATAHLTLKDIDNAASDRVITFNFLSIDVLISRQPRSLATQKLEDITLETAAIGTGEISYQWYENTAESDEGGTRIEGATSATYTVTAPTATADDGAKRYFYCEATSTADDGSKATIKTKPVYAAWYTDITPSEVVIETKSGTQIPNEGLELAASGAGETLVAHVKSNVTDGDFEYKWNDVNQISPLGHNQELSISLDWDREYEITCSVRHNVNGMSSEVVKSASVKVKVIRDKGSAGLIYEDPVDGLAPKGSDITLTARLKNPDKFFNNEELFWQWQYSLDRRTWEDIEGASGSVTNRNSTSTPISSSAKMQGDGRMYVRLHLKEVQKSVSGETYTTESYSKVAVWDVVGEWDGSGTAKDPYLMKTPNDLKLLASLVNAQGITYEGVFFKMANDIELPQDWTPIGSSTFTSSGDVAFDFDGADHLLTIPEDGLPLIGKPGGCTVHDLNLYGKKIAGFGLVQDYVVTRGHNVIATLDNITLKEGTQTLESGLIGGYASGVDAVKILNCTAEKGVVIGYDKSKSNIGTFAGELNGTVANCVSHATVYGVDFVGGIVGNKGQTMGDFYIINCNFDGNVIATGSAVGGITGAGYGGTLWGLASAPNSPCASVRNCLVTGTIEGVDQVGGILGRETARATFSNGLGYIENNVFAGKIVATGSAVGGIVGQFDGMNDYNHVANNYFLEGCGASKGIGAVLQVQETAKIDPNGADAATMTTALDAAALASADVVTKLNNGPHANGNWVLGTTTPVHTQDAIPYRVKPLETPLLVNSYDNPNIDGRIEVYWTDGKITYPNADELTFEQFQNSPSLKYTHYQSATVDYNDNGAHVVTFKLDTKKNKKYPQLEGTVYVSISNDDRYAVSNVTDSGTVMASVPVDLAKVSAWAASDDYAALNLNTFVCYADDSADYQYEITLLHLLTYINEQYSNVGAAGITVEGSAGSAYLKDGFFGHDENLMYFVNGHYPEKPGQPGIGATCDEIILHDGDRVDVGLFTDWDFYNDPAAGFHYFIDDKGAAVATIQAEVGKPADIKIARSYTKAISSDAADDFVAEPDYALRWGTQADFEAWCKGEEAKGTEVVTDKDGNSQVIFPELGEYVIWAAGGKGTPGSATENAIVSTPAHAAVTVKPVSSENLAGAVVMVSAKQTYTGKALTPAPVVTLNGKTLVSGTDYTVSYKNNVDAGTATVTITGKGAYSGTATGTFKIAKVTPTVKAKTVKAKAKKKTTIKKAKAFTVTNAKKVTFKKVKGNKKITVNKKNGKVTVKKGLKKGKVYKVRVKVTAKADKNHNKLAKTVTLKVKVK